MKTIQLLRKELNALSVKSIQIVCTGALLLLIPNLFQISVAQEKNTSPEKVAPSEKGTAAATAPAATPEEQPYQSPWKKDGIPTDYLKNILLPAEQTKAVSKNQKAWVTDYLRVGLLVRPRFEAKDNGDFNKKTDDSYQFTGQTSQVWFLLDPSPYYTIKVTIQDMRVWGGTQSASVGDNRRYAFAEAGTQFGNPGDKGVAQNNTFLREGWVLLKNLPVPVNVQIGRMAFTYGDQRMIGVANWLHNALSFDGVRFIYESDLLSLHAFATQITEQTNGPNGLLTANGTKNGSINDSYFYGTYNSIKTKPIWIDLYAISYSKKWLPAPGAVTTQDRLRQQDNINIAGFRITNRTVNGQTIAKEDRWDWTFESAWQYGSTGLRTTDDWYFQGVKSGGKDVGTKNQYYSGQFHYFSTGYKVLDSLRLGVQYSYASGDRNRTDASASGWNNLFMPRHSTFNPWNNINGQAEMVGWSNARSYSFHINYKTEKMGEFMFVAWDHYKAAAQDAWYSAGGGQQKGLSTEDPSNNPWNRKTTLGRRLLLEYDFTWIYTWHDNVSIWAGFSLMKAQDAIRNIRNNASDPNPDNRYTFDGTAKFYYLMVAASF
ncbi:hypothetical protein CH373_00140 [Leptospira perolatii]|uniref:Alginate export domain-containing protein n=1 Tax=Leptospira perolatii TaxID=2023191 RepID=A0A2M9ZR06_9LEPT|nr:alginate export family protein [Leptospira perolatii]PJZ70985.1 hypothetical protein CH360_00140 [Leptospira perolatii]PJZ74517.1 hypothetical protein CH373_00140 [Leptospira perolatii]